MGHGGLGAFQPVAQAQRRALMRSMAGREDVTLDGRKIKLCCNIGSLEDVDAVLANDGQGIGLFRSEFLYLAAGGCPSEEDQFQAYKRVALAMKGKRVIVRTLDIGADKQAGRFHLNREENPALGLRAIRICLNHPEVFRTQLRALYRASACGKIAIMFPMIASVWEVKECRRACQRVMDELTAEGIPFNPDTEIGIMIETPAAVFMAPELARLVDFFSVGTNDLTQYTLACDRHRSDLGKFFDPHHPAVLRALKMAADAAHEAGIWIGICGELGADPDLLPTFLAIGIDELSVAPSAVLPYLEGLDMVLVMTVEPGFGGQAFLEHQLDTIRQVRALIERYNPACRLEVDGGINAKTAAAVVAAGADTLVAGSAVYGAAEPAVAIAALRGD